MTVKSVLILVWSSSGDDLTHVGKLMHTELITGIAQGKIIVTDRVSFNVRGTRTVDTFKNNFNLGTMLFVNGIKTKNHGRSFLITHNMMVILSQPSDQSPDSMR